MDSSQLLRQLTRPASPPAAADVIPTGSVSLDILLGGGWPAGMISALYGPAGYDTGFFGYLTAIAALRVLPRRTVVLCTGSFDLNGRRPGIRREDLVVTQNPEIALGTAGSGTVVILSDFRETNLPCRKSDMTTVLVIPQQPVRADAEIRLHPYGTKGWASAVRISAAAPAIGMPSSFPVNTGRHGFTAEMLDVALAQGIITARGTWYAYGNRTLGGSWKSAVLHLAADRELASEILARIAAQAPVHPQWQRAYT